MKPSEFKSWVETLKPGDKVAVDHGKGGLNCRFQIGKVKALQKLHLVVDFGTYTTKFRLDGGYAAGERGLGYSRPFVTPLTPAVEEHVIRDKYQREILGVKRETVRALSTDRLRRIHEILKEHDLDVALKARQSEGHDTAVIAKTPET